MRTGFKIVSTLIITILFCASGYSLYNLLFNGDFYILSIAVIVVLLGIWLNFVIWKTSIPYEVKYNRILEKSLDKTKKEEENEHLIKFNAKEKEPVIKLPDLAAYETKPSAYKRKPIAKIYEGSNADVYRRKPIIKIYEKEEETNDIVDFFNDDTFE